MLDCALVVKSEVQLKRSLEICTSYLPPAIVFRRVHENCPLLKLVSGLNVGCMVSTTLMLITEDVVVASWLSVALTIKL